MIDINLLKQLYQINSPSREETELIEFITSYVHDNFPKVIIEEDKSHNIYLTKGKSDSYPVLCAHMDQVSKYKGKVNIIRYNNIIFGFGENNEQVNIGADDKNGIWVALQLLKSEPIIKVALFVSEEIGCVGSSNCDMTFFDDARFVIQCDRRNGGDFIHNASGVNLCDINFISKELLNKYNYKPTYGIMTDVQQLKRKGLNVACCNLSCGYYDPHTSYETTDVKELINCLKLVREIIKTTGKVEHTYIAPTYNYSQYLGQQSSIQFGKYGNLDWEFDD